MAAIKAEYIWLDGYTPTASLRSKTKILDTEVRSLAELPDWAFDGSSTEQAEGRSSDCILKPVRMVQDPIRGNPHVLVLCEVLNPDGTVHPSNSRAHLREVTERFVDHEPWFGIEQEYTLYKGLKPLAWPQEGVPGPQGPYYCGVGTDKVSGRDLVEAHLEACLVAGLHISGINAEVMPGQWEFQVGAVGPLEVADELWLSRWLLHRLGEAYGVTVSLAPKPLLGDWNGAGAHTNFSTKAMRALGGLKVIEEACQRLSARHKEHIAVYGAGNEERLTGKHETCPITEFRYGVSDRGASIRIPIYTAKNGCGYLEDRRPAANMDPYKVCARLIETVCAEPARQYSVPVTATA
ncbi:glutamine synthetase beta-grasp domain-containing protein [Candidatus Uhrbacteria bacterium]|nr:glutamine synthetase beta-grasp domain-containing protein [Candidatus Uhrbacteria bacterium]